MKTSKNQQKSQLYYIKTFGCQMNHSDSERIAGFLEKYSYKLASDINAANLVIFNTCGVRQMAEDRVYGQIHNLRKSEIRNSKFETKRKIILTGCLANRKDVQRRLKDKVDLFCEIKNFPKELKKILHKKTSIVEMPSDSYAIKPNDYLSIKPKYETPFSAYVPIMTGCDNFCAYCVVPYARGREASRPAAEIIREVKNLVKNGYKEIILLGQNVNSYEDRSTISPSPSSGRRWRKAPDEGKVVNFSQLLKKINAIPGNFWIQFVSNHPKDVTDEMIETVAKLPKVCESFHLPIQAGNDEIIRKMNRKYTAKEYLKIVGKIKAAYKKYKPEKLSAITSDIIVGFPGETRQQFLDSAKVMEKVRYDMVFFGQFSPRPGTAAWQMKDNVSKKEKVRREKHLNEILKKNCYANNKKYVGTIQEILIENKKAGAYFGRTRTGKNVKVHPVESLRSKEAIGVFHRVKITKANIWNLEGKIKKGAHLMPPF